MQFCDLDSGIYEYYEMNNESYYNPTGDYRELLQRMSGEYVVLTEKINIQMDDLLSPEHLRKVLCLRMICIPLNIVLLTDLLIK